MNKRDFLKTSSVVVTGIAAHPLVSNAMISNTPFFRHSMQARFTLPPLPYAPGDLEPHIDTQTMEIHHGKHHAGYVRKLNDALPGSRFSEMSLEEIVSSVTIDPKDTGIRNNGGGHYNHSLFWSVMAPANDENLPTGKIGDAINGAFGDFEKFKEAFTQAALSRFGSGWAWLCQNMAGKLFISSTPNQDNPLMFRIVSQPGTPLLGIDVWEHAYYLNYQNRRAEYVSNFFNIINWDAVNSRMN